MLNAIIVCVLFCLAPLVAIIAPRSMAFFLPLAAFISLPYSVSYIKKSGYISRKNLLLLLIFISLITLAIIEARQPIRALRTAFFSVAGFGLSLFLLQHAFQKMSAATLKKGLLGLTVVLSLTTIGIFFELDQNMLLNRVFSTNPTDAPPFLYELDRTIIQASLLLWVVVAALRERGALWLPLGIIGFTLPLIWCSMSQAASVGLSCGVIAYLLLSIKPPVFMKLLRIGTALLIVAMPLFILTATHYVQDDTHFWAAASGDIRLKIWHTAINFALEQPLFGHGVEAARTLIPQHGHPHNGIVQIWLEFGLCGVAFFAYIMDKILKQISHLPAWLSPAAAGAFVAWLVVFNVGYSIWQGWWIAFSCVLYTTLVTLMPRLTMALPTSSQPQSSPQ